jgi:hypothetical protein
MVKHATQTKELSQEVWGQRHCHITQTKDKQHNAKQRHSSLSSSQIFQSFSMSTVVNLSNTQKQRRTLNSMSKHQKGTSN